MKPFLVSLNDLRRLDKHKWARDCTTPEPYSDRLVSLWEASGHISKLLDIGIPQIASGIRHWFRTAVAEVRGYGQWVRNDTGVHPRDWDGDRDLGCIVNGGFYFQSAYYADQHVPGPWSIVDDGGVVVWVELWQDPTSRSKQQEKKKEGALDETFRLLEELKLAAQNWSPAFETVTKMNETRLLRENDSLRQSLEATKKQLDRLKTQLIETVESQNRQVTLVEKLEVEVSQLKEEEPYWWDTFDDWFGDKNIDDNLSEHKLASAAWTAARYLGQSDAGTVVQDNEKLTDLQKDYKSLNRHSNDLAKRLVRARKGFKRLGLDICFDCGRTEPLDKAWELCNCLMQPEKEKS